LPSWPDELCSELDACSARAGHGAVRPSLRGHHLDSIFISPRWVCLMFNLKLLCWVGFDDA